MSKLSVHIFILVIGIIVSAGQALRAWEYEEEREYEDSAVQPESEESPANLMVHFPRAGQINPHYANELTTELAKMITWPMVFTQKSHTTESKTTINHELNSYTLPSTLFEPTTSPRPTCTKVYSCLDCHTARVCLPLGKWWFFEGARASCPELNPWCDSRTGTCVRDQPADCQVKSLFSCIRGGRFPDLTECRNYHQCAEGTAYSFRCPYNAPFYNVASETCENNNSSCASRSVCNEKQGVKAGILDNKQVFAYCVDGVVVSLDRCMGQYRFNQTSQNCEPHCPHAGRFPDAEQCQKFYQCTPESKWAQRFALTHHECPSGEGFLESEQACVVQSQVPNCQVLADTMSKK